MHTIKPLDGEVLDRVFATHRLVVTVEEHFVAGGLGGAVAEYRADKPDAPRQVLIGVPNDSQKAGTQAHLLDMFGLTAEKVAARVAAEWETVKKENS
jgi:transketolase